MAYKNPPKEYQFTSENQPKNNGRPVGSKSLATIVAELEKEDFDWSKIPLKQKDAITKLGSPWRAIMMTAVLKSLDGDIKAMEWLRRAGYGNTVKVEGGLDLQVALVQFVGDDDEENEG